VNRLRESYKHSSLFWACFEACNGHFVDAIQISSRMDGLAQVKQEVNEYMEATIQKFIRGMMTLGSMNEECTPRKCRGLNE
jgi:hypothetical protein